jgi:hypothetical protein
MSREMEYEFLFVVDGVSIDDDEAVAILADAFDGVLSWNRGIYRLAVSGPGRDSREAAATLVSRLATALPGLRVMGLDPAPWPSSSVSSAIS